VRHVGHFPRISNYRLYVKWNIIGINGAQAGINLSAAN